MKPILLTEAEAAAAMRLCAKTLRKARQDGELRYVLIGRSVRYTIEDLESFVESRRQVNTPCPATLPAPKRSSRPGKSGQIIPFHLRKARGGRERL